MKLNTTVKRLILAGLIVPMLSCGVADEDDDGSSGSSGSLNPEVGKVDDSAGFYVKARNSTAYTYITHDKSGFSLDCTADEGEDVDCIVEAEELDLYFNGVDLQYNLPSDMCDYVLITPYFFFRWRGDTGPTIMSVTLDGGGNVTGSTVTPAADGYFSGKDPKCNYDYSDFGGPNCCEGDYLYIEDNAGTVSSTTKSWGGDKEECLAGPAMDTQEINEDGWPMTTIKYVEGTGLNEVYEVKAPIEKGYGSNVHVANYFENAEHSGTPAGIGDTYHTAGSYRIECVDRAMDLIAQIEVFIREWNTEARYNDMSSCAPTDNDACWDDGNISGTESAPFGSKLKNDIWDWRDFGDTSDPQTGDGDETNDYPSFFL